MKKIPYGKQYINDEDIDAVISVLKSDFITQGPKIKEFEDKFAHYIGSEYAVAVANGTAALHLSALALGINPGDKVITTPITFAATANCVRYCDGEVIFADIDPETYLLDINKVKELLENDAEDKFKGIIPVDFAGYPVNLEAYRNLADEYGLWLLEDACHAPGGYFIDSSGVKQYCGNGNYAELAIFSFHPVKHIAAGEGGMITTNNEGLYHKLRMLRTHGIQQRHELRKFDHGVWYYEMQELGFNYRITDMQSALGISQLKRAEDGLRKRREISQTYEKAFYNKAYAVSQPGLIEGHAYHLYVVEFENRDGLIQHLRSKNIFAQVHYIPLHLMPYYKQFGWKNGDFPSAEEYYTRCLSLPMYPTLEMEELQYVIECIQSFYEH